MRNLKGLYLVVDPAREWKILFDSIDMAVDAGVKVIQIWDHWKKDVSRNEKKQFIEQLIAICSPKGVLLLMHEDWEIALEFDLDGVHFDVIPEDFSQIQSALGEKIVGITVTNDWERIIWAEENGIDYISFCAIFPSHSVQSCEIVDRNLIQQAKDKTSLLVILSGGIYPENISELSALDYDGIAVISGILDAENPAIAVKAYYEQMHQTKN